MLPNSSEGTGRLGSGHGHCWELGAPPPPSSSGRSLGPVPCKLGRRGRPSLAGQLIKTSPSPQSSAWPGNCLLPLSPTYPSCPSRAPCRVFWNIYSPAAVGRHHALQRQSPISVQSGAGLRRPSRPPRPAPLRPRHRLVLALIAHLDRSPSTTRHTRKLSPTIADLTESQKQLGPTAQNRHCPTHPAHTIITRPDHRGRHHLTWRR
jgi:hypothetical protein